MFEYGKYRDFVQIWNWKMFVEKSGANCCVGGIDLRVFKGALTGTLGD
jgi:hypothetical protein